MSQEQPAEGGNAPGGNITKGRNYTSNPLNIPLTKKYFKLLQALHHSEILSHSILTGVCPKGMERQVQKLASFIKPSSPSLNTTERVKNDTQKWLRDVLETLRVHYDGVMGSILGDLPVLDERALQVAVGWSKLKYKRRFTSTSVDTLRTMLITPMEIPAIPNPLNSDSVDFPPLLCSPGREGQTPYIQGTPIPKKQRTNLSRLRPKNTPTHGNNNLPGKGDLATSGGPLGTERYKIRPLEGGRTTITTEPMLLTFKEALMSSRPTSVVMMELPPQTPIPFNLQMEDTSSEIEAARGPPGGDSHSAGERSAGEGGGERGATNQNPPQLSNVAVHISESLNSSPCPNDLSGPPEGTMGQRETMMVANGGLFPNSPLPNPNPSLSWASPPLGTDGDLTSTLPPVPNPNCLGMNGDLTSTLSPDPNLNRPVPRSRPSPHPPSPTYLSPRCQLPLGTASRVEPVRHPNVQRKIFAWNLEVTKPILFIGDSNLAKIPTFENNNIQVDSFPGASCDHLRGVIAKLAPQLEVEKVILSVGLVNCLKKNVPDTLLKQMRRLLAVCDTGFPNAIIYVAQIHFSDRLGDLEKSLLRRFNEDIVKSCEYLPVLETRYFNVMPRDPVHWTPETADRIFKLWLEFLN